MANAKGVYREASSGCKKKLPNSNCVCQASGKVSKSGAIKVYLRRSRTWRVVLGISVCQTSLSVTKAATAHKHEAVTTKDKCNLTNLPYGYRCVRLALLT